MGGGIGGLRVGGPCFVKCLFRDFLDLFGCEISFPKDREIVHMLDGAHCCCFVRERYHRLAVKDYLVKIVALGYYAVVGHLTGAWST